MNTSFKDQITWSQKATDIARQKYFYKNKESNVEALILRVCLGLETALKTSGLFTSIQVKERLAFIAKSLATQAAAFNSPVWFNCGLYEAYKLESYSEHFAFNQKNKKIESIKNAYARPQVSACFIQSVEDNMESIFDLLKSESRLFRYGSGTGTNFSNLRSKYEKLKNGGLSSGLISFLEIFDKSAGAIKSGGTTRRAAKMVCLDVDHPEIFDFINWKKNEEKKARVLIQAGYSADLDGEVYKTVSGQNSNNSVRVTDQFMQAVLKNKNWNLKFRTSGQIFKTVKALEVWNALCESAWECADPGIQFYNQINRYNTCAESELIKASNPCSEFMFLDDTACNLASINLLKFYDEKNSQFLIEEFLQTVQIFFEAQECLVDYASYPTEEIAQNSHDYRPLGMGFTNLGGLLMAMGLAYDSPQACAWASFLASSMTAQCYITSSLMAKHKGSFRNYKKNQKTMLNVIKLHQASNKKVNWKLLNPAFHKIAQGLWTEALALGKKHGYRNAQATVIAPTGTIGLIMDCVTTGIEPEYSLIRTKKLSGGGVLNQVNALVPQVLRKLNYTEKDIQNILKHIEDHNDVKTNLILSEDHKKIFQTAVGDNGVSADGHLNMMAAVQPFLSGAISKTVNLKKDTSIEEISQVYLRAWKLGLKSVAIYRDQSKFVQPLNSKVTNVLNTPQCPMCGEATYIESGCYRCISCGYTSACVG